jgi:hypothetical protein
VIAHFDEPAHSLVASDNGDRLIALARRGETWRLARLDLVARRAARWCEATLDCWAESYDGAGWMVGSQGDLWSVDAAALRLDGPWRASAVLPSLIARNAAQVVCLTTPEGSGLQLWSYQQPSLRLRERRDLGLEPEEAVLAIAADGVVCTGKRSGESDRQVLLLRVLSPVPGAADVTAEALALHPGAAVLGAAMSASRVVLLVKWEADVLVAVLDRARLALRAALRLEGSTRARARVTDESIAVADDRGRLIVLDPQDGRVLHDLRT